MTYSFLEAKILIVDDQKPNVLLLGKMLKAEGYTNIISTTDSRNVISLYLEYEPDVILLDINMPYLDGFQVMEQLKELIQDQITYLPIVVLTAYTDQKIRLRALESGAKDFLTKPFDRLEVLTRISNILEVRLLHNQLKNQNKILENKVSLRTKELLITQKEIINRLGRAAEYRDNETGSHIMRMSHYTSLLAEAFGMNIADRDLLIHASKMHDIGKIGVPDTILLKPGKLDPMEWEVMKKHTTFGAEILSGGNSKIVHMAEIIALTHHEKWDGTGYPNGLRGEDIPLVGRISAICDVFDALTSDRPYKKAWPVELAVDELKTGSGKHFDPKLPDIFIRILPDILEVKQKYQD